MADFAALRRLMLDSQIKPNKVTDVRVHDALLAVPREDFVPEALRPVAYVDEDLNLGAGRYLVEPRVFARMLQEAAITAADTVLDIAAGTGYTAAVLGHLAKHVTALESVADLAARAKAAVAGLGLGNVAVVTGELAQGHAAGAPYDVILIEASVPEVPAALYDQLAEGGRLIAVLRNGPIGVATLYTKTGGIVGRRPLFDAATPVLPGFERPAAFVF
ncbi:protein-L-isoaspartate(D-aspartate) O-methyltransferase [Zavarzinia compransoris]|uniref:Protein-L-isoaspartate O-methyltransferase n=2 Tax=Zavarzinia compransoris TaxID=1264899 RepID=A0A317E9D3_9PROT|nr:protein-L-isoaspartate O-methyltransferase [Zavarzinia compransoris]PWR23341.1 protein-L-isoaspartate O-methyltransferase [Zavarzinia compransoris]TDP46085.1 protein-L-isoaspartate(D-aspartate) O-methyltransferase [Zavarzinia compransoris]